MVNLTKKLVLDKIRMNTNGIEQSQIAVELDLKLPTLSYHVKALLDEKSIFRKKIRVGKSNIWLIFPISEYKTEVQINSFEVQKNDSEVQTEVQKPKTVIKIEKIDNIPSPNPIKITPNLIGIDKKAFLEIVKENNPKVYARLMGKDKYYVNTLILSIQEYMNQLRNE